jgi:hypothetical protein
VQLGRSAAAVARRKLANLTLTVLGRRDLIASDPSDRMFRAVLNLSALIHNRLAVKRRLLTQAGGSALAAGRLPVESAPIEMDGPPRQVHRPGLSSRKRERRHERPAALASQSELERRS